MLELIKNKIGNQSDLILVAGMMCILLVLFLPIPPGFLDFLLITNFSFALLVLLMTFYVETPLQFSTFPSLLLIATLFRLSLNIAATRLILGEGDAGQVIDAIGSHVVAGNYVIGMIIFLVLIVVQYVVVTNGAQRVAEVAARFTLDGMPGKQMSIDADLNMGLIDAEEAQSRRSKIEKESSFYGAMDGASKFVKGDAVAGIIIILIDIIGGLAIGVAQLGMSWSDALQVYTLLTIGDGIVTQIPALIISTGTGIIVTRAASDTYLSQEISQQLTSFPKILGLIFAVLLVTIFIPGIPAVPVFMVLILTGILVFVSLKGKTNQAVQNDMEAGDDSHKETEDLYSMMAIEPIEIKVGHELISLVGGDDSIMMDRIGTFRKQYALDVGFVVPKIRIKDEPKFAPNSYQIFLHGAKVAEGEILSDRLLAINPGNVTNEVDGVSTKDPTYGLPAVWIVEDSRGEAKQSGYTIVDPLTVIMTHITEMLRQQSSNLFTRAETERLIERVKSTDAGLVDELIPNVMSLSDVQKVLQKLLSEKVSIRNLEAILEVLVDAGKVEKSTERLTELVRQRIGGAICQSLINNANDLYVLVLDPTIEQKLVSSIRGDENSKRFVLEPGIAEQVLTKLAAQVEKMMGSDMSPVLLCAPELRGHLRNFTERVMPNLSVLSMSEVPSTISVKSFGMVSL